MWFKPKQKNRRFQRDRILEVKMRTQEVRSSRVRLVTTTLVIFLLALLSGLVTWRAGQWLLNRFLFENPVFALRTIDVQTDGVIPLEQIRRWCGVRLGENLLALNLARIKRDLELVPLVQAAAVDRVLPHALKLRIVERQAIAQIILLKPSFEDRGVERIRYYLDSSGFVMGASGIAPAGASEELPILFGWRGLRFRPGLPMDAPKVRAALRLISEFERSPMVGLESLSYLELSAPEVIQVTSGQGSRLTFGVDRIEQQLRRWRLIYDYGLKAGKRIASLDLSVSNNLPARWREAATDSEPPPKIKKPAQGKKNV